MAWDRSRLLERVEELRKILAVPCDPLGDSECLGRLQVMVRELEADLAALGSDICARALAALDALSELSRDDWKVVKRLLAVTAEGSALITRSTDISTFSKTIRDHLSSLRSGRNGPVGLLVELGIVERSPLVYDDRRKRYVRYNWLSPRFFKMFEDVAEAGRLYERYRELYMKLVALRELIRRVEQYRKRYGVVRA